jgi:hypothetical protein
VTAGVGRDGVSYVMMHGPIAVRVRETADGFSVEYRLTFDREHRAWRRHRWFVDHDGARHVADALMEDLKKGEVPDAR